MAALPNQRHELFAQMVFMGEPVGRAYTAAGYKAANDVTASNNGSRLLARPDVSARVDELRAAQVANTVVQATATKEWVLESLVSVAKRCMQAEPVLDSDGNPTGEYKFQHQGANRALELVGKELGMFVDRKDVTVRQVDNMSRDEIMAELATIMGTLPMTPAGKDAGKLH